MREDRRFKKQFNVYESFVRMYVCNVSSDAHGSQNRVLDPLGTEL